jgi:hypothetical protein
MEYNNYHDLDKFTWDRVTQWAILVELAPNDHIYVTEDTGKCWDIKVKVYNSIDKALEDAKAWKNSVVVPFDGKNQLTP